MSDYFYSLEACLLYEFDARGMSLCDAYYLQVVCILIENEENQ